MDSLTELRRRKAELKIQIEQQRGDLKKTFAEVRTSIEPANLLKKAVVGALGFSGNDKDSGLLGKANAPLSFLSGLLIRDPKIALAVKVLVPTALKYLPRLFKSTTPATSETVVEILDVPMKAKIYGRFRKGVTALRNRLKKTESAIETESETSPQKQTEHPEN